MTGGKFVPQNGRLSIFIAEVCIGAVGASGGSGDEDVAVLTQALELVID